MRRDAGGIGPNFVTALAEALRQAANLLTEHQRSWALVGALAVSARTEPRFTRDIDIAVAVADDRDAEALVRDFQANGYVPFSILEQEAVGRLATTRLTGPARPHEAAIIVAW
jgi:hypothetical protein